MSVATKAWVKAEQKLGAKAARLPVVVGLLQSFAGVGQVFCVSHLLAMVLVPMFRVDGFPAVYVIGFSAFAGLRAICLYKADLLGFEAGAAARRRLRSHIMARLLAAGPTGLRGRHSAELAAVAVDRVEAMDGFHGRWIAATQLALLGPLLVGSAVILTDWRSGILLLLAGALVPVAMAMAGIGAGVAARKQFVAMTRLQVRFLDRIRGISTIVLAGRAGDEAAALGRAADELRVRTIRVLRVAFLSSTALDLAAAAALVLIVVRFAPLLHGEAALVPAALFSLLLVPEFFAPLRAFAAVYQDRMAAEAVAEDMVALPELPAAVTATVPAAQMRNIAANGVSLAFEDVSFGWGETKVLEHLSFRVPAGEILLLTGASGAGKSTVIDLILGFITPASGMVTFNGMELATLVAGPREKLIGWIGQKPFIFGGSILENIKFGRPEASDEQIAEAVKLARLADVIAGLPRGLQTQIGETGFGLSGGQAQRIAIARAFLKDAPLLLLDEPTAHLDPAIERDVLESLKRLAIGRTVVLASHSALAGEFARETGARRLDLEMLRHKRLRVVA
jgi:ATP-binding cassette subfamily C protein CydD